VSEGRKALKRLSTGQPRLRGCRKPQATAAPLERTSPGLRQPLPRCGRITPRPPENKNRSSQTRPGLRHRSRCGAGSRGRTLRVQPFPAGRSPRAGLRVVSGAERRARCRTTPGSPQPWPQGEDAACGMGGERLPRGEDDGDTVRGAASVLGLTPPRSNTSNPVLLRSLPRRRNRRGKAGG